MDLISPDQASARDFCELVPPVIRMAGPESYDYQFGGETMLFPFLRAAWLAEGNTYSHDTASLLLDEGRLAGALLSYPGAEFYTRHEALQDVGRDVFRSMLENGHVTRGELLEFSERVEQCSYLNAHVPDDVYYIMTVVSLPDYRGKGIGSRLFDLAIERARRAGARSLHLDVLSNNTAVQFYEAKGMTCAAEIVAPLPCRKLAVVPMEQRMTLTL